LYGSLPHPDWEILWVHPKVIITIGLRAKRLVERHKKKSKKKYQIFSLLSDLKEEEFSPVGNCREELEKQFKNLNSKIKLSETTEG
jgi:hypothetical protein